MKRAIGSVLVGYALWGLLPVFWKQFHTVDAVYLLAVRIVMSMVFCLLLVGVTRRFDALRAVLRDRRVCLRLAVCGVVITANWWMYIYAVSSNHILDGSLAFYISPLLSILIGRLAFGERLAREQWAAAGLALAGVLVPVVESGQPPLLALGIGATFSIYGAIKKQLAVDSIVSLTVETLCMTPPALLLVAWMERDGGYLLSGAVPGVELALLLLTGVATSVPLLFFAAGVHQLPVSLSGMLLYLNPTLQLLLGVLVYREPFTGTDAVMFALVFAAVALFLLGGRRRGKALPG